MTSGKELEAQGLAPPLPLSAAPADQPPSYSSISAAATAAAPAAPAWANSDMAQPTALRLAGRFIHAGIETASPMPLFELSHSYPFLSETDNNVQVSRIEHGESGSGSGSGNGKDDNAAADGRGPNPPAYVKSRSRHLFTLKRPRLAFSKEHPYYLESASRAALRGCFAVRHRWLGGGWKAVRTGPDGARVQGREEVLYEVKKKASDGSGELEWIDGEGRPVAREARESDEGPWTLQVVRPLPMVALDAVVALWCLRLWIELAERSHQGGGWKGVKRVLQTRTGELPNMGPLNIGVGNMGGGRR